MPSHVIARGKESSITPKLSITDPSSLWYPTVSFFFFISPPLTWIFKISHLCIKHQRTVRVLRCSRQMQSKNIASDLQVVFFASYPICCRAQILQSKIILQRSPGGHIALSQEQRRQQASTMHNGRCTSPWEVAQRQKVMTPTWCQLSEKHIHGRPLCSTWRASPIFKCRSHLFQCKVLLRLIYPHLFQSL